jgi:hypothetical protein
MAQYLLAVHMVEGEPEASQDEMRQAYASVDALNAELRASGAWVFAGGLQPPDEAIVVRATSADVATAKGSFVEGKRRLGGFWIITAPDLDSAVALAGRAARACGAPVEVRQFQEDPTSGQ